LEINALKQAIRDGKFRVSDHADEEANADSLLLDDVLESVLTGEIIEEYPTDWPYPSCLVLGFTGGREPVHSVWAYNAANAWAVLVTVYRPDPRKWTDWRFRRKQ